MLGYLSIIFVPYVLKLLFFFTVFVNLGPEFADKLLGSCLQLLDLGLLEVKHLLLDLGSLDLIDFIGLHLVDLFAQIVQLGFCQRDLLAAVSLLFLKLNRLLLLLVHLLTNHASCLVL